MRKMTWMIALMAIGVSFSAHAQKKKSASAEKYITGVLTFDLRRGIVGEDGRNKIKEIVALAKKQGQIKQCEVIAWSDLPHPRTDRLPRRDRLIADRRILSTLQALQAEIAEATSYVGYSMAENANWISRNFEKTEVELEAVFAKKEKEKEWDALSSEELNFIRANGGPRKAVIILKVQ